MFLCVTTTPAGARVEPDVYCRKATFACAWGVWYGGGGLSKSSASTSITSGEPGTSRQGGHHGVDGRTTSVITATGAQSFSAPETRSSCAPNIGTGSGTAMSPASSAPRSPTM